MGKSCVNHLTAEMEIGFERLDPPASPDLRRVELTVELELAEVAVAVAPELGYGSWRAFDGSRRSRRRPRRIRIRIRPLNDKGAVHFHVGRGLA